VGETVHLYPGRRKAFYTAESDWMITFPAGAESVHKAMLVGACQLSKFFFFPGHVCGTGLGYCCWGGTSLVNLEHRKRATSACKCSFGQLVKSGAQ